MAEPGKRTPWIPDDKAPGCMLCSKAFGTFNRRSHCRRCGGVFCGGCSNSKCELLRYGFPDEKVRVCNNCLPQAQRERDYARVHLPLISEPRPFSLLGRLGAGTPVIVAYDHAGGRMLTVRPANLGERGSSRSFPLDQVTDACVRGGLEVEFSGAGERIRLKAMEEKGLSQWVDALNEGADIRKMHEVLVSQIEKATSEIRKEEVLGAMREEERKKEEIRLRRAQHRENIRAKYGVGGGGSGDA
eukprot:TRINITY_DN10684_c0_g1_i4.p1 TRINITY_DN10684_c0_g1~~TRINITY_DN10684_c0_g1_i4.p1  ORF type:complete len:263 (-),score=101.62 TRINITY_DN10684_c0_g1_i4:90-821(-)